MSRQGQLDMCHRYAQKRASSIVEELPEDDHGASGAAMDLPKLQQAFDMAEDGSFDVLVPRELDRLTRNLAKQLYVEHRLKNNGVATEYVSGEYDDTPEGLLMKNVRAVVAEYERLTITERMLPGRRQKVEYGNVMVHRRPRYGYRKVEESKVVRLIYKWYTEWDGEKGPMSMYAIAKALTRGQIPTPGDKRRLLPRSRATAVGTSRLSPAS